MTDRFDELKGKISKIVTKAVESQMDLAAFYSGENDEAVDEIMELIEKYEDGD